MAGKRILEEGSKGVIKVRNDWKVNGLCMQGLMCRDRLELRREGG